MDWKWVVRKREEATSPPSFWPEQWKARLAIDQEGSLLAFLGLFCIIAHPQGHFLEFFLPSPPARHFNTAVIMYICLCTLALGRVTNHCNI